MREIIQMILEPRDPDGSRTVPYLYAVCNDGTVWYLNTDKEWEQWELPPISQDGGSKDEKHDLESAKKSL